MSKDSCAKCYPNNKERLQKKASGRYQSLSQGEKEKWDNMVVNNTKIYQKMKNKSLLSMVKKYYTLKKNINIRYSYF